MSFIYCFLLIPNYLSRRSVRRAWRNCQRTCESAALLAAQENFRAKRQDSQHLGPVPKAVTGAVGPTLAQPQLSEMDSPERNEAHKAPCTPCQGVYQAQINGRLHSLRAPEPQGQIQYLGGVAEVILYIGLGLCMCVCLACFNQVVQQQTLCCQVKRFRRQSLSVRTKGGRSRGTAWPNPLIRWMLLSSPVELKRPLPFQL